MPLYEYKCSECGEKFDRLVRAADADGQQVCPRCGSVQTKRQISAFGWAGGGSASGGGCAPSFGGG